MQTPKHIVVICGGQSTEHAVSILSARNIIQNLSSQYRISVVLVSECNEWFLYQNPNDFLHSLITHAIKILPGEITADCVFPIIHGTQGEDGALQGLLEILQIPYVGADVLGSAVGMDKDISKRLLRAADVRVADWYCVTRANAISYAEASRQLGKILFVKANSLGSSVGTEKVTDEVSFDAALAQAFCVDDRVLIEKAVPGREIECSVLGNENPKASLPGEIILRTEFYSYAAKYLDPDAARVETPANNLSEKMITEIQKTAIHAFQVLRCSGMARVDFFLSQDEKLYVNEINTLPGFTNISMYPKNWEVSGLPYSNLLDELISLAIERFIHKKSLNRVYRPEKISCPQDSST